MNFILSQRTWEFIRIKERLERHYFSLKKSIEEKIMRINSYLSFSYMNNIIMKKREEDRNVSGEYRALVQEIVRYCKKVIYKT